MVKPIFEADDLDPEPVAEFEGSSLQEIDIKKYKPFTEVMSLLQAVKESTLIKADEVKDRFAPPEDKEKWWNHPFGYARDVGLGEVIDKVRTDFTGFIIREVNKEYPNIEIDVREVQRYIRSREAFSAAEVIAFIKAAYADQDGLALEHIRSVCNHLLPYGNFGENNHWEKASRPEHLGMKGNDRGIELRVYEGGIGEYDRHYGQKAKVAEFLKLVDSTLGNALPRNARGARVELGAVYRDVNVKLLRYYKNNNLKVIFHTKVDCDKVKAAIFERGSEYV